MSHWWEIACDDQAAIVPRPRAVAYYRHPAQDRQENSIPIQREQVRDWAEKNGVELIKECVFPASMCDKIKNNNKKLFFICTSFR